MPRVLLKKVLPSHTRIKEQKILKIFGPLLYKKEIWSISRRKVLSGVFIGVFVAFIPMPFQMVLVTFLAILLSVNLPVGLALIWISNPITMPFIYYFQYELGNVILNNKNAINFTMESMSENLADIALSLYLGAFFVCISASIITVFILNLVWIQRVKKRRIKLRSIKTISKN